MLVALRVPAESRACTHYFGPHTVGRYADGDVGQVAAGVERGEPADHGLAVRLHRRHRRVNRLERCTGAVEFATQEGRRPG